MMAAYPQIPLYFNLQEALTFNSFVVGANKGVLDQLQRQLKGDGEALLYLWGQPGAGCSHLLQAACHQAGQMQRTAIYLPMDEICQLEPTVLEGIEAVDLVCLDHLEVIAGQSDWEEVLFHLFNRIMEHQGALLIGAAQPPVGLGIKLADLLSRFTSCAVFQVALLKDEDKILLLQDKADEKGIELSQEAAQYILNRSERSIDALLKNLTFLDRSSLSAGRKLTIPFIKQTMGW